MTGTRLAHGGIIDRNQPLSFTWNGRTLSGFAGDSLASALLANGVKIIGRSFKYHRPRGIMAAGSDEPNGLVDLTHGAHHEPNARATTIQLAEGMQAKGLQGWPNVEFDLYGALDLAHNFIPAGFYYKTFIKPSWAFYERAIRRMAGLGTAQTTGDKRQFDGLHAHCDVLIIGAGIAGLSAALAAASAGFKIILVDDKPHLGGSLQWNDATIDGLPALDWIGQARAELSTYPNLQILSQSVAFGYYDHNLIGVMEHVASPHPGWGDARLWQIRADQVILATGGFERPLLFADNDRPGVMLADATLCYARQYGVLVGSRMVIGTNNDSAYASAMGLSQQGAEVTIADIRSTTSPSQARAEMAGVRVLRSARIVRALGRRAVEAVDIQTERGTNIRIDADVIASSGGWSPAVHLFSQSGGRLRWCDQRLAFVPDQYKQKTSVIGGANGTSDLTDMIAEAFSTISVLAKARGLRISRALPEGPQAEIGQPIKPYWRDPAIKGRQWVDFQNDVTVKDIELAARENYISVEHLKRYTTLGMATDQGKTSNIIGLALMAELTAREIPDVGTTTFRPPFVPVSLGAIAGSRFGRLHSPIRQLPSYESHRALGAAFREYGGWWRPAFYPKAGEDERATIAREAKAVRAGVGLLDASSLGKISVRGPDAAEFLNLLYYNELAKLKPGKLRYCFLLRETGNVYDDGVVARIAEDHYLLSPSSSHTQGVLDQLELWHQTEYPSLRVHFHDLTAAYATISIAGPRSRDLLTAIGTTIDLSDQALPHMSITSGQMLGHHVQVMRVSFTGERAYELTVKAGLAPYFWECLMYAGADYGATPFGIESLSLLRAEKGYILIGTDTDGLTLPSDLGMTGPLLAKKVDFVGKRSLMTPDARRSDRRQLIGLVPEDDHFVPAVGTHAMVEIAGHRRSIGWITSSWFSPHLNHAICLGMIEGGRELVASGATITLFDRGKLSTARAVEPCFFDPRGERLHG